MLARHSFRTIWITTIAIIILGLAALYSASHENVRVSQRVFYDQLFCAVVGLVILFLLSYVDYRRFYELAYFIYIGVVLLLLLVLISGRHVLGAKRWMEIFSFSFQPSEPAKLAIILVLARYFSDRKQKIPLDESHKLQIFYRDFLIPLILIIIPVLLIFKQPDLGTALIIFGIFVTMLFASEISYKYFFGFMGFCLASLPVLWHLMKNYQKERLMVFLNPNIDPLGAGYTIIQSKIAIGSGRLFGKGWLSGTQNQLNFLPERHTDFIFSVIGEEWGFLGAGIMLVCFYLLIKSAFNIAQSSKDPFGQMVAVGIIAIFGLQVIINIGMVLGLCPVVGLTLPLVSYGRSSFLVFIFMLGFLLNFSKRRTIF